jgi:hypothetical protein
MEKNSTNSQETQKPSATPNRRSSETESFEQNAGQPNRPGEVTPGKKMGEFDESPTTQKGREHIREGEEFSTDDDLDKRNDIEREEKPANPSRPWQ